MARGRYYGQYLRTNANRLNYRGNNTPRSKRGMNYYFKRAVHRGKIKEK